LSSSLLYSGTVELEFKDKPYHAYYANGEKVPSVTTILKVVSKGDALTWWAVNQTVDYFRSQLQGEISSETLEEIFKAAKFAWKAKKEEAAGIGTIAHQWLEKHLRGETPDELPANEAAANSVRAALDWLSQHHHEPVAIESRIYSKKFFYAGTLDYLSRVDGDLCVCDWKTSTGLWPEYFFQTAAYVHAHEEESGQKIDGRWLLRIDKVTGQFEELFLPRSTLSKDFKAFKGALALYERLKELK